MNIKCSNNCVYTFRKLLDVLFIRKSSALCSRLTNKYIYLNYDFWLFQYSTKILWTIYNLLFAYVDIFHKITKNGWLPLSEKCPNTEFSLVRIFLYLNWIQENTDQKNSVFGYFSHSVLPIREKCLFNFLSMQPTRWLCFP